MPHSQRQTQQEDEVSDHVPLPALYMPRSYCEPPVDGDDKCETPNGKKAETRVGAVTLGLAGNKGQQESRSKCPHCRRARARQRESDVV